MRSSSDGSICSFGSISSTTLYWLRCGVDRGDLPLRIGIVQRVVDSPVLTPSRAAASRSITTFTCGPARSWSERHRRCPASPSAGLPAPAPSAAARARSWRDHGELVLRAALPSAAAQILCREQEGLHAADLAPTARAAGRSRASDETFALRQRLQADGHPAAVHRRPAGADADPWSATVATAGSASSTSTTARWRSSIGVNEMSGEACVEPIRMPVSCYGRKPFGTTV